MLILQNMPDNTLGHLTDVLDTRGISYRYWHLPEVPPESIRLSDDISGLVILGGSMNVDEIEAYPYLHAERTMIREAIDADLPVFGICLGAQLIARDLAGSDCGFADFNRLLDLHRVDHGDLRVAGP